MNNRTQQCLYCYQSLAETDKDYHAACSKKFFGTPAPALLPYDLEQLKKLTKEVFTRGNEELEIEAKFSLELERKATNELSNYFSISGLEGHFVLKAPTTENSSLPELEDLTLHLAKIAQLKTVEHSLIRLESGELALIYQRIDRTKKGKIQLEDMCQLSGTLTEDKYQGSIEKIGKLMHTYSSNPGFDVISLFELTIFCFLTGCGDMHLKNISLSADKNQDAGLSPAYGLIPTLLLSKERKGDMALSINGKKKNLNKSDFDTLAEKLNINSKTLDNTYKRFQKNLPKILAFIELSFLGERVKQQYKDLIKQKTQTFFDLQVEETTSIEKTEDQVLNLEEEISEKIFYEKTENQVLNLEAEFSDEISNENTEEQVLDLIEEVPTKPEPIEKKSVDFNKHTGEAINQIPKDPSKRQLNLFG